MNATSFEDAVFLLNIRIRMVRDAMRLNPPGDLFMEVCMDDISFIDRVLDRLAGEVSDGREPSGAGVDYAADTEWQFSQLLTEFLLRTNPFFAQATEQSREKVLSLRNGSNARRKVFEKVGMAAQGDLADPVVSSAELSILFGGD
ncbi:MAG: hypothetical protein FWE09_02425 [Treponema sp.]|nr:hypothetical protein [Treponema sp.]